MHPYYEANAGVQGHMWGTVQTVHKPCKLHKSTDLLRQYLLQYVDAVP
jgi:hypothetical protein